MGAITEKNLHFKRLQGNVRKFKSTGERNIRKGFAGLENQ